MFDVGK